MVKPQRKHFILLATCLGVLLGSTALATAQMSSDYTISKDQWLGDTSKLKSYSGSSKSAAGCIINGTSLSETGTTGRLTKIIETNLDDLSSKIVSRIEDWGTRTADAIMTLSGVIVHGNEWSTDKIIKAEETLNKAREKFKTEEKTLEVVKALSRTQVDKDWLVIMSMYRPELVRSARQTAMADYVNELNNIPLNNKFLNTSTGLPLPGYVDTSRGAIAAMGQEFRNFVQFFCDARSVNGKLASTRFLEYNSAQRSVSEYWCGRGRGIRPPPAMKNASGQYMPISGAHLSGYIDDVVGTEATNAQKGEGKGYLVNAPKNVAELYFEPHTLKADEDIYTMAERQFIRFVIGRASNLPNTSDFNTGEGQRAFMNQQARTAKLALARYPFAEMFSEKIPTMPEGSAAWAAGMIESNIGNCSAPQANYKALCDLTMQLRRKGRISESEFFDVLYNRQFEGTAFHQKVIGMTEGQLRRTQVNLQAMQMALNYKRNRLKEQQLALMAAIYAQQNQ
jgi:hypothetical protein